MNPMAAILNLALNPGFTDSDLQKETEIHSGKIHLGNNPEIAHKGLDS